MVVAMATGEPRTSAGTGAGNGRLRVAVLVFDDVEVLDFAGPFEVFGVARSQTGRAAFDVVTVALAPGEVVARNGLRLTPHMVAADLGPVDVLVVPGGYGTRREIGNGAMLEFVGGAAAGTGVVLSVCTGALVLGAAGLLRGLGATTHFGALDELRALDCGAQVFPDARIVDNGRIVTTTGVSAGIDGALYVVARLVGDAAAAETARYMQYDWRHRVVDGRHVVKTDG